ncbi:hypothetical protein C0Q70_19867 [Pomacea canaliculata]|uniref:Reverse transcriptase domain-containing protein n=1 Tax=Pomacea canaliculata TaxID=400727 RepID=A0A2T7NDY7_POMCA|nr:hypothetical protein C0Q70_19867 [Pomacea canaliculata]
MSCNDTCSNCTEHDLEKCQKGKWERELLKSSGHSASGNGALGRKSLRRRSIPRGYFQYQGIFLKEESKSMFLLPIMHPGSLRVFHEIRFSARKTPTSHPTEATVKQCTEVLSLMFHENESVKGRIVGQKTQKKKKRKNEDNKNYYIPEKFDRQARQQSAEESNGEPGTSARDDCETSVKTPRLGAKSLFVQEQLEAASGHPRKTFDIVNSLLGKNGTSPVLPEVDVKSAADQLSSFFVNKIKEISAGLESAACELPECEEDYSVPFAGVPLTSFTCIDESYLRKLVARSTKTSCAVDPSAYRPGFSTETALLRVTNDILCSVNSGNLKLLVLLDLSSAFDTINHRLLLQRLSSEAGIQGAALQWIASYLAERSQIVIVGSASSEAVPLVCGVPQGSILGPLLFSLYVSQLGQVIERFQMGRQFFADDTQILNSFPQTRQWLGMRFNDLNLVVLR